MNWNSRTKDMTVAEKLKELLKNQAALVYNLLRSDWN